MRRARGAAVAPPRDRARDWTREVQLDMLTAVRAGDDGTALVLAAEIASRRRLVGDDAVETALSSGLEAAIYGGRLHLWDDLLRLGASLHHWEKTMGTFLHVAATSQVWVLRRVLDAGVDPLRRSCSGDTPLMHVGGPEPAVKVELLMAAGVPLEAVDPYGLTALMFAAHFASEATIAALLDAGANSLVRVALPRTKFDGMRASDERMLGIRASGVTPERRQRIRAMLLAAEAANDHAVKRVAFASRVAWRRRSAAVVAWVWVRSEWRAAA